MGILTRFKDIMASNVHAIFNNREDKHPERAIEKYMMQARSDLGQVKAETEALRVQAERAQRAVDDNMAEQEKLQRYIDKCNESGNTSDARQFERKLDKVKTDGEVLNQKLIKAENDLDQLSEMREKLSSDIGTLEAKLSEVKNKVNMAQSQEKLNNIAAKSGSNNTTEMFSRMNEKADRLMDRANAMAELQADPETESYEELQALARKYDDDGGQDE